MPVSSAELRPSWPRLPYPRYSAGLATEEYFYQFYITNKERFDLTGRQFIPIFWTNCAARDVPTQKYLDQLDPAGGYFTVCRLDRGVPARLPANTLVFATGGKPHDTAIAFGAQGFNPPYVPSAKTYTCSCVISDTHRIRRPLHQFLQSQNRPDYYSRLVKWEADLPDANLNLFKEITASSKFALAPRGYVEGSYRFFEILQMGAVPVVIHDGRQIQPWADKVSYDSFSLSLHAQDLPALPALLDSIPEVVRLRMVEAGAAAYERYFSFERQPELILEHLESLAANTH